MKILRPIYNPYVVAGMWLGFNIAASVLFQAVF